MLLQQSVSDHSVPTFYIISFCLHFVHQFKFSNSNLEEITVQQNTSFPKPNLIFLNSSNETKPNRFGLSNNPDQVKFWLYHDQSSPNKRYKLEYHDNKNLINAPFRNGERVIIITHGFISNADSPESPVTLLRKAYSSRKMFNIITVDWSDLSSPKNHILAAYPLVVKNVQVTGKRIGELITKLVEIHVVPSSENFHLIGHSLGAHVMGVAGHTVALLLGTKVSRITGLDPAGPLYSRKTNVSLMLSQDDGKFVDVVHSDISMLGSPLPLGTIDYYIDGGIYGGCNDTKVVGCAHSYAPKLFAKSVENKTLKVLAYPCNIEEEGSDSTGPVVDGCALLEQMQNSSVQFGQDTSSGTYFINSSSIEENF